MNSYNNKKDCMIFKHKLENNTWSCAGTCEGIYMVLDTDINTKPIKSLPFKIIEWARYRDIVELMFSANLQAQYVYIWILDVDTEIDQQTCISMSKDEYKAFINI